MDQARPIRLLFACLILMESAIAPAEEKKGDALFFTCFRDNGQAGVYLCSSDDGLHFTPCNGDKPIFTPPDWKGQNLTRDASILYHDGLFRMVWTSHWKGRVFGYAESIDLEKWSDPRQIKPFPETLPADDQPENVWAPEIHFDPSRGDYFILFSSTTKRQRTNGDRSDNKGNNTSPYDNRIFITRTKDGRAFSDAKLFFDQGFSCIDAVMQIDPASVRGEKDCRWVMVVKCSRDWNLKTMPGRNLWLTFTGPDLDHPNFTPVKGPIAGNYSKMFNNPDPPKSMAEGPSLLQFHGQWLLSWDEPAGAGIQLATSPDLETWTHHKEANFPRGVKHGTLFAAPREAIAWMKTR